jgi:hypothetical protein
MARAARKSLTYQRRARFSAARRRAISKMTAAKLRGRRCRRGRVWKTRKGANARVIGTTILGMARRRRARR